MFLDPEKLYMCTINPIKFWKIEYQGKERACIDTKIWIFKIDGTRLEPVEVKEPYSYLIFQKFRKNEILQQENF